MSKYDEGLIKWYLVMFLIAIFILGFVVIARADEISDIIPFIIKIESNGNPNAVSNRGAIGLMQITPIVLYEWNFVKGHTWWSLCKEYYDGETHWALNYEQNDLFEERINKIIGEWYLRRLRDHYKCPTIEHVLASYNGGITRLRNNNWDIDKMPKETRQYVRKVMKLYRGSRRTK